MRFAILRLQNSRDSRFQIFQIPEIPDSRFRRFQIPEIPDSRRQIPDSRFQIPDLELGIWNLWNRKSQIPNPKYPKSQIANPKSVHSPRIALTGSRFAARAAG
ncbi:MAG: hypothetical protein IPJ30_15395 [Acidobacteria bacterium]|nr:hypothetical protein [Acidobacteriota bacterium]